MTSEILAVLVKVNLAAGLAILAVLVLRAPLRPLIGPRLGYSLWFAVPLAAIASLLPARQITAAALPALPLDTASQTAIDWIIPTVQALPANGAMPLDLYVVALAIWAAGATCAFALVLWLQERSLTRLGGLQAEPGDPHLYNAGNTGFGPAVIGAFRPIIVVPADFKARFNERERVVVLAHERVHLARSDARINALVVLMQCLNWFNPLVHIAARLLRIDQELACDAAVMARYPEARRSYAEAMLKTQLATAPLPLGCYWPARSENPLKERLVMLKLKTPGPVRHFAGAAAVTALTLTAGYAAWTAAPAMAQAPAAAKAVAQGVVSSALTAPTQAKVAAPAAAATVKAGAGGGPSDAAANPIEPAAPAPRFSSPGLGGRTPDEPAPLPDTFSPEVAQALKSVAARARTTKIDRIPNLQHGRIASVEWTGGKSVFTIIDDNNRIWGYTMAADTDLAAAGLDRNILSAGTEVVVMGLTEVGGVAACGNACVGEAIRLHTNGAGFVVQPRESALPQQTGSAANPRP